MSFDLILQVIPVLVKTIYWEIHMKVKLLRLTHQKFLALEKDSLQKETLKQVQRRMLKAPPLKSLGLHFSVLQDRPDRGALICSKICSKNYFYNISWQSSGLYNFSFLCANLCPISLLAYFIFLNKPRSYTSTTYFWTYYMPPT